MAPNLPQRDLHAEKPNQTQETDVMERFCGPLERELLYCKSFNP